VLQTNSPIQASSSNLDLNQGKNMRLTFALVSVRSRWIFLVYQRMFDTNCLVIIDFDFTPLVTRALARTLGKFIIGFGEQRANTKCVCYQLCSKFLYRMI